MVSIDVRNAYVDFPIFDAKTRSMKKRVLGKVGGKIGSDSKVPIIEALQDVNLQLSDGDRLALVGHNGAGKSTLLRLLSGIYEPTRGSAKVTGKVAPVFDLGVGMDPETSGFENIIVRGLFLGKSRREMEKRLDDIAEFTELGDYLAMPLRTYSTGMRVRLALGVVTSIDPEILILDEGLGAVDASFMNKARDRLKDLVKRSGILVFASHSDELLLELCDQAMWMDEGRVRQHGRLREVLTSYKGKDPFQNVSREVLERLGQANPDDLAKPGDGVTRDGQATGDTSAATAPASGG
ncbi:galactan export ABC transporter ATP-binding subunit Wzt/RfbE [Prauserella alba]|uniref:ABC transporter ATP-binding protein n=1 Tax=Prauserella alba TaxID=176898 RepID=A0ABN1VJD4_9PSEU|nr:ABC transporter ATP-binding protein [Prauserella alba]MCP2182072.1 ABC-2 type transport system ATP-binding protein [Prauserella alba]